MKEPAKIEKVTDDVLSRSIISSVIGIILCMVCLVGTTWAWYSLSVESGANETFGANFDFTVAVTKTDSSEENDANGGTLQLSEAGVYTFDGETYTVKLTKSGSCTATKGFCKVIATKTGVEAETITYYAVDFTGDEPISFTVKGSGTLKLIPMWGTPVEQNYEDLKGKIIELASDATAMMSQPKKIIQAEEQQQPPETEVPEQQEPLTEEPKPEEEPADEKISPEDEIPAEHEEKVEENIEETSSTEPEEPISEIPEETTAQE